jgi:hypothetical protein
MSDIFERLRTAARGKAKAAAPSRRRKARPITPAEKRTEKLIADEPAKKARQAEKEQRARRVLGLPPEQNNVFRLTPKQQSANQLLQGLQRHTMLMGGSRSGKTFLLVRAIVTRALKSKEFSRHVIFRLRGNACRQTVWMDTFAKVMRVCFPEVKTISHLMDGYIEFPHNKAEIWFAGLDDKERVEKILGMEFCTIYFCECSQIPYASIETALTRLAQKVPGLANRAYYDLNPTTHKHWTYLLFIKGLHPISRTPLVDPENYKWMKLNPIDNTDNIDKEYIKSLEAMSPRARKRFLDGEYLTEVDGALWTEETLERTRVDVMPGETNRIVVSVDPSGAAGEEDKRSDEIGVTVAAKVESQAYVLKDATMRGSPEQWGRRVVQLYKDFGADCIVAERNYGGDMVRATIHAVDPNVKVKLVTAARGKVVRAEPVSALYEANKAHHVGESFKELEDEMQAFTADGYKGDRSPNRTDALVWALTELMLGETTAGLYNLYKDVHAELQQEKPNKVGKVIMPKTSFDPEAFAKALKSLKKEEQNPTSPKRDKNRAW